VDPEAPPEISAEVELRPIVLSEFDNENTIFQFENMLGRSAEGNIDHGDQIRLRHMTTGMFVHFHGDVTNVCNHVCSLRFFSN
jgi:dolichyl-phosphate-mannose--protein O-mannosyl transferase